MFLKRIARRLIKRKRPQHPSFPPNVIVGKNTEIRGSIDTSRAPNSKLIIGDDCLIGGSISLETDNAHVEIGNNVFIGNGTIIICSNSLTIESDILISYDCLIQDSDNHNFDYEIRKKDLSDWKKGYHDWSTHPSLPIKISFGSWIGAKVIILKGVTIGEKSIVGAGSVVTKSVEPLTLVAGNPARVIRKLV